MGLGGHGADHACSLRLGRRILAPLPAAGGGLVDLAGYVLGHGGVAAWSVGLGAGAGAEDFVAGVLGSFEFGEGGLDGFDDVVPGVLGGPSDLVGEVSFA